MRPCKKHRYYMANNCPLCSESIKALIRKLLPR